MNRTDKRGVIEELKLERRMITEGGYGRSVRTPWKDTQLFRDSTICLNYKEEEKQHPCTECLLHDYVPERHQNEDIPCHYIPLTKSGETIAALADRDSEAAERALVEWIDTTIAKLETELALEASP